MKTMDRSVQPVEWKPADIAGNDVVSERRMPFMASVQPPVLVPHYVIDRCSFSGALNECVRCDGRPDNEICRDLHISAGYMSKFLRSVGEAWFKRMVLFMRTTRCLAPLQKLAHEMGCDVVLRSSVAAELAEARARVAELERQGRAA
jgi:hypothetical protein